MTWNQYSSVELSKPIYALIDVEIFKFDHRFRDGFEGVMWPRQLQDLYLGLHFNRPIPRVPSPPALCLPNLGGSFHQPVSGVSWPPFLQQLTFGADFNPPFFSVCFLAFDTPATHVWRVFRPPYWRSFMATITLETRVWRTRDLGGGESTKRGQKE